VGTASGAQAAQASLPGAAGSPLIFTAAALSGEAASLADAGGNGQAAAINTPLAAKVQAKVADEFGNGVPGVAVLFTTPLGMRIDEGLGGTPADISVRIFGPDLDELARLAEQAETLIRGVEGLTDLRAEHLTGLPQLQIAVNREATARVGLAPVM